MKVAIITDSTAVMNEKYVQENDNLFVVPLQILVNDDVYKDGVDITPSRFFDLMDEVEVLPSTSQPSVGDVLQLFKELKKIYDEILYITLSSKISGTYQTGMLAKNEMSNIKIEVFDSLNTSVIQKAMTEKAIEMANQGENVDNIINALEGMRDNSSIYLVVDDLKHLGRTGRVNNLSAVVGALLKIKPILCFEDGFINLAKKVRTLNKAHNEIVDILDSSEIKESSKIMIAHAKGWNHLEKLESQILEKYPDKTIEVSELSPVISVHTGPNTVGIAWIK